MRLPPHRVVLAPHGTHDLLQDEPAAPAAGFRVLFVGRFEVRKGFDLAIATAMRLGALLPDASFASSAACWTRMRSTSWRRRAWAIPTPPFG